MKNTTVGWGLCYLVLLCLGLSFPKTCNAHFGVIIPSDDIVEGGDSRIIALACQFMHPFEQVFMDLEKPIEFGVVAGGRRTDLVGALKEKRMGGHAVWVAEVALKRPGNHVFFMIPRPYWEPAEESYIQHYTKVVVGAFGLEEGWDRPVGLKTEIVPRTRPYGLWTGNLFCGQVLLDGKPVSQSTVEAEYYNSEGAVSAPAAPYITQTVKTDERGRFCYAMPRAGWWGFAALNESEEKIEHDGRMVPLELGAVIWVRVRDMK